MDTFDLKWPQSDATFYTDGWRCRIVWRERRGGLGGTIDNNDQCKRRVADSLRGAPYLLGALRARGHGLLASEIEAMAGADAQAPEAPALSAAELEAQRLKRWLDALPGSPEWQDVASGRAKHWQPCGELDGEQLMLKAPTPRGKQEWLLKRTFAQAKRKAEYVAAGELRGICAYLAERGLLASGRAVEQWLADVEALAHEALADAARLWRDTGDSATH